MTNNVVARGVDCGYGPPAGVALAAAGIDFLAGYLRKAEPSSIHVLTPAIVADQHTAGRKLVLLYEDANPAFMLTDSGVTHAKQAVADVTALGIPLRAVYFCCDTNPPDTQYAAVERFLDQAATVLHVAQIGFYGKAALVDYLRALSVCTWYMQSAGWDNGEQAAGVHIVQTLQQVTIGGVSCDVDQALAADYGQWPPPDPPPSEDPLMATPLIEFARLPSGAIIRADLLAGTWQHIPSPTALNAQKAILDARGIPYHNTTANDTSGYGAQIGN